MTLTPVRAPPDHAPRPLCPVTSPSFAESARKTPRCPSSSARSSRPDLPRYAPCYPAAMWCSIPGLLQRPPSPTACLGSCIARHPRCGHHPAHRRRRGFYCLCARAQWPSLHGLAGAHVWQRHHHPHAKDGTEVCSGIGNFAIKTEAARAISMRARGLDGIKKGPVQPAPFDLQKNRSAYLMSTP
jgi:hypothetical protein